MTASVESQLHRENSFVPLGFSSFCFSSDSSVGFSPPAKKQNKTKNKKTLNTSEHGIRERSTADRDVNHTDREHISRVFVTQTLGMTIARVKTSSARVNILRQTKMFKNMF